jgi:NitT/TauT family transport system permease protein
VTAPPRPPPWWKTLRADPPFLLRIGIGAGFVALIILIWFFLTLGDRPEDRFISPSKLPSPGEVFISYDKPGYAEDTGTRADITKVTFSEVKSAGLGESLLATLRRVLKGIGLAALIGVGLGVLAGSFRALSAALNPLVIFLRSVPMGALLPLTLIIFKATEQQKSMFIFFAVVPFVFSDTLRAIAAVPQRYVETAETLGASRGQIIRKVLFPLALPDIVSSLRFQFGLAFGYIMLAEAIAAEHGLGAMLNVNEKRGNIEQNYLLLFVIAAIAFAIDWGVRTLQRGVFPYRKDL